MLLGVLVWFSLTSFIGICLSVVGFIVAVFESENWEIFKDIIRTIGITCIIISFFPLSLAVMFVYRLFALLRTRG